MMRKNRQFENQWPAFIVKNIINLPFYAVEVIIGLEKRAKMAEKRWID